jgi:hypothetical protein
MPPLRQFAAQTGQLLNITKAGQAIGLESSGHLVETFAVGEILKQVNWADEVITASHFRTEAGDEVDLLRDRLGDRFVGGFVLNLGELAYRKESKIAVMPLSALWSLPARSFSQLRTAGKPVNSGSQRLIQGRDARCKQA